MVIEPGRIIFADETIGIEIDEYIKKFDKEEE